MEEIYQRFVDANINNTELPIPKEELLNGQNNKFYTNLKSLLKKYNNKEFANTAKNGGLITLDAFMKLLHKNNFRTFGRFSDENDAYYYLKKKSDEFSEIVDYNHFSNPNFNYLYKPEIKCIQNKFVFAFKNSNINKWLFDSSIKPRHNWRQSKKKISGAIKRRVWNEYTDLSEDLCPLCCSNNISKSSFHAGHIIPEAKGGKVEISNLIPICGVCNSEMGTNTLEEFCNKISESYEDIMKLSKRNKKL
jgi:hypothetical protein